MLHLQQLRKGPAPLVFFALLASLPASAQAPGGYYTSVDTSTPTTLRNSLHQVIDDHQRFNYSGSGTDTLDILKKADQDPANSSRILDVYRNKSYSKSGGGFNREHTWPKSHGFPNDGGTNYPYVDCHQLFLSDTSYNSSRGNYPFGNGNGGWSELTTDVNDGQGGGSGTHPGNSNWVNHSAQLFEVWSGRKGDIARAMFYMDIRYEGGNHGVTGFSEPDLRLTDSAGLINSTTTGSNESVAYMGMLSVLLQWHYADPVDAKEIARNNQVFAYQGNRNPFADHPEWVDCLYGSNCVADTVPPATPTGLSATAGDSVVNLNWSDNTEPDNAGYRVYRGTSSGGPYFPVGGMVTQSAYSDSGVTNGIPLYYIVSAEDFSGNESGTTGEVSGTPMAGSTGGGTGSPWINELHYDNSGTDVNEFVEIAGPAGLDLAGFQLVAYNGNGGVTYETINLSGFIPDQGACVGSLAFSVNGLQNGGPDGVALVDLSTGVLELLSYEGTFTATNGPASGMTSTSIGVSESSSTSAGTSLQLGGTGAGPDDFTWQASLGETPGQVNQNQAFSGGCSEPCGFTAYGLAASPANTIGMIGVGAAGLGTSIDIVSTNVPGFGSFNAVSLGQINAPLFGGIVLVNPGSLVIPLTFVVGLTGTTTWTLPIPVDPAFAGLPVYFQCFATDSSQPGGFALSNGLELVICP